MQNPTLSTSIPPGLTALLKSILAEVVHCGYPSWKDSQKSSTDQIGCSPTPGAKTYMSQQTGDQTQHSDTCEDSEPLAQPLHTTSGPAPPLQKELQSSQKDSPEPRNQNPAPTSPQAQHQSTAS